MVGNSMKKLTGFRSAEGRGNARSTTANEGRDQATAVGQRNRAFPNPYAFAHRKTSKWQARFVTDTSYQRTEENGEVIQWETNVE